MLSLCLFQKIGKRRMALKLKTMKKTLLISGLLFVSLFTFSQKELAKKLIDTLASDSFYGRGYVNNGDKIAANFIEKKFKEYGAQMVTDSYFQEYRYNVNTFPTKVEVTLQNKKLITHKRQNPAEAGF